MPSAPSYPGERPSARGDPRRSEEQFYQYQAGADSFTVLATLTDLITFAGYPDSIELTAIASAVNFELSDLTGPVTGRIHVPANQTRELHLKARVVRGIRDSPAAATFAQVVGKWSEPKLSPGDADPSGRFRGSQVLSEDARAPETSTRG